MSGRRLGLFDAYGVELEYMIVDRASLAVRPFAERVLVTHDGEVQSEVEHGEVAWSNELVSHVVELKTNGPAPSLAGLASAFQTHVERVNALLAPHDAMLLPGAMHPTMNPSTEMHLWPWEYGPVYEAFHRIFDCRGHGWANLQSAHLNLPFASDDEFRRLHAAIRVVLPLIPALAASSPVADGKRSGFLDYRMEVYRHNARRVPSVSGLVVPEPADSRDEYEHTILDRVYRDLEPLDPQGILRHEWVNARGAIARFERGTVEIRVTDVQECPAADLAIAAAVVGVIRGLAGGGVSDPVAQNALRTEALAAVLWRVAQEGAEAGIADGAYLDVLGVPRSAPLAAGAVWDHLLGAHLDTDDAADEWRPALNVIRTEGPLAQRMVRALGADSPPDRTRIDAVYRELAHCLAEGRQFRGLP